MDQSHCDHSQCAHGAQKSVCQTLSEMDWERGLWNAAFNGDIGDVQRLIDKARNRLEVVNAPDNAGYTAMHYAARNGHEKICQILLDNGAVIDSKTSGNATPLHKAAAAGKIGTVKFLLQYGANVEVQDVDGETALHKAAGNNRREVFDFLLETYPQLVHIRNSKGKVATITI